jgi:hypothetical protein
MWEDWAKSDDPAQWAELNEDDATYHLAYRRDMAALLPLLNSEAFTEAYDFVWIGYHMQLPDRWKAITSVAPVQLEWLAHNRWAQGIGGTFAYLVSKRGAKKMAQLLRNCHKLKEKDPVDVWMMRHLHDEVAHLATVRPLVLSTYYIPGDKSTYDSDIALIS